MEEMHKSIDSSSGFDPDPNDSVHQSLAYEVNFGFNKLKIDQNEPQSTTDEVNLGFNHLKIDENKPQSLADEVNLGFNKLKIDENDPQSTTDEVNLGLNQFKIDENEPQKQQSMPESAENDDDEDEEEEEEDEEEEGEFTFMCIGENDSLTEEMFENGQIRPVFPLFDQSLLFGGDNDGDGKLRLPIHVPVDKVFIESPRRSPSSTASGDEKTGTICAALPTESNSGTPEINIKSNSTGFSKLWRFRDKMNRSNSDGRDAFVFLETPQRISTTTTIPSTSTAIGKANAGGGDDFPAKDTGTGGKGKVVKKGSKVKKVKASAHEVYLKQRGEKTEDERRRSYLPYRPGLMGFFTNVNGGLSKNVHPF